MGERMSNAGRPTGYRPEFCEKLIEHMSHGYSFESFCGVLEVSRKTLYNWVDQHPEFKEAKEIAFAKAQLFWEFKGIDGLDNVTEKVGPNVTTRQLNSAVWIFNMKNRFKWVDKVELSEDQEKPIGTAFGLKDLVKK